MSNAFSQKVGRDLFAKHIQQYTPADPLYETYIDKRGKERRRKRELPPGLSPRDAKILQSVKRRAHHLDKGFRIFGMRFGWTFIIGIIPGAGDVADATLNYVLIVRKARQADIPGWLLRRMLLNNAISAGVGFVPIVGGVIIAAFKANSRNAALFEEFLRIRGEGAIEAEQHAVEALSVAHLANQQGAGRAPVKREGNGWFAMRGKGKSMDVSVSPMGTTSPSEMGRFVEDVPAQESS